MIGLIVRHRGENDLRALCLASSISRRNSAKLPNRRLPFFTKLELGAKLVIWAIGLLKATGRTVWVVADGGYAKAPFLKQVMAAGAVVVSRLRKDAALWNLLKPSSGVRGRPRKYGTERISLAKRAAHRGGWVTGEFRLYGRTVTKTFKLFQATYRPVGGLIAVLLVKEADGSWRPFFCTKADATAHDILERGGGPRVPGTSLPRHQRSSWQRGTTSPQPVLQHRRLQPHSLGSYVHRALGLEQETQGPVRPQRFAMGRCRPAAISCRSTQRIAASRNPRRVLDASGRTNCDSEIPSRSQGLLKRRWPCEPIPTSTDISVKCSVYAKSTFL